MERIDTTKQFTELYNLYLKNVGVEHNDISFNNYCQLWNKKIIKIQNEVTLRCLEELEIQLISKN